MAKVVSAIIFLSLLILCIGAMLLGIWGEDDRWAQTAWLFGVLSVFSGVTLLFILDNEE